MSATSYPLGSTGAGHPSQWMNVVVEFAHRQQPDGRTDRGERYRLLCANAQQHHEELAAWIASEGLEGEVKDLGDTLAFDLLFVTATPQATAALNRAPGVVAVRNWRATWRGGAAGHRRILSR